MTYKKVRGDCYPLEIDLKSSPTTVYFRKNINEIQIDDRTEYEYDEAIMSKEDYIVELAKKNEELADVLQELICGGN